MSQSESLLKSPGRSPSSQIGLLRKTTITMMTMLSRILGFTRDVVLAVQFGAGGVLDAWVIAFKIPNFFRRLFGEGHSRKHLSQFYRSSRPSKVMRVCSNLCLVFLAVYR